LYAVGYMNNGLSSTLRQYNDYEPSVGLILYSSDNGTTWSEVMLNNNTNYTWERLIPKNLYDITFQGNDAWIVGGTGYIIHSTNAQDGTSSVWGVAAGNTKEQNSHTQWTLTSVSYISGTGTSARLMAVGNRGTIVGTSEGGGLGKVNYNDNAKDAISQSILPELYQNVPNPFDQSTTIAFRLVNKGQIQLSIVDGLGKTVSTLIDGRVFDSGLHSIDYRPEIISSGVYYCRLTVDGNTLVKPLIIIR